MSFIDELRNELHHTKTEEPAPVHPVLHLNEERFRIFMQEELSALQAIIRESAKAGKFKASGEKHVFDGTRLWHEGDYRQGTESLATFYPFLARDSVLEKEILEQKKRLLSGYHYEVRFSLTAEGNAYFQMFTEELLKEGITVSSLFVRDKDGSASSLPYTARGNVKYDFELEHYLNDYPRLYYTYHVEI